MADNALPDHINTLRALHDSIVNNGDIPGDLGDVLRSQLPSEAHVNVVKNAAMRDAQMTQENGPMPFGDSALGSAAYAIASLPVHVAQKVSDLLQSDDPHHVAAGVKFMGETAREHQQRMEDDAMGAASLSPEQSKDFMIGASRLPMRMLGAPVDMYTSQGLETIGGNKEDSHPVMGSEWLIDKAIKYGLAPERRGILAPLAAGLSSQKEESSQQ